MVLVSVVIHLLAILLFSGLILPHHPREPKPIYYVDLVHMPVKDPQAGRPDARPREEKPPSKPAEESKQPEPVTPTETVKAPPKQETVKIPETKPEPKPAPKPEPKPAPKPEPKPAPKPEPKPAPKPSGDYQDALAKIEQMQQRRKMEELKAKLAALAGNDTRQAPTNAPVGMIDGKGSEAGISYDAWLHQFLKQAWSLSKYQVSRRDLETTVSLLFDARGRLIDYRFIKPSGESRFDDSVKRAILELKELPNPPGSRMEKEVVFNLKELLD